MGKSVSFTFLAITSERHGQSLRNFHRILVRGWGCYICLTTRGHSRFQYELGGPEREGWGGVCISAMAGWIFMKFSQNMFWGMLVPFLTTRRRQRVLFSRRFCRFCRFWAFVFAFSTPGAEVALHVVTKLKIWSFSQQILAEIYILFSFIIF